MTALHLVPGVWYDIALAPTGDETACIDVWADDQRYTDCCWIEGRWRFEVWDEDAGDFRWIATPDPTHFMPVPAAPEVRHE